MKYIAAILLSIAATSFALPQATYYDSYGNPYYCDWTGACYYYSTDNSSSADVSDSNNQDSNLAWDNPLSAGYDDSTSGDDADGAAYDQNSASGGSNGWQTYGQAQDENGEAGDADNYQGQQFGWTNADGTTVQGAAAQDNTGSFDQGNASQDYYVDSPDGSTAEAATANVQDAAQGSQDADEYYVNGPDGSLSGSDSSDQQATSSSTDSQSAEVITGDGGE